MPRVILEDGRGFLEVHFWPEAGDMFAGRGHVLVPCTMMSDEEIRCKNESGCGGPIVALDDFVEVWMSKDGPQDIDEAHKMQDELLADPAGWLMEQLL